MRRKYFLKWDEVGSAIPEGDKWLRNEDGTVSDKYLEIVSGTNRLRANDVENFLNEYCKTFPDYYDVIFKFRLTIEEVDPKDN